MAIPASDSPLNSIFSRLAPTKYGLLGPLSGAHNRGQIPEPTRQLISSSVGISDNNMDDSNAKRNRHQPSKFVLSLTSLFRPFQSLRGRLAGWRCGVLSFAICASTVFFINFVVTVWGLSYYETNQGNLSTGDCDRIKQYNSGLHVIINVFSTVLLSGSNYCMQCLTAPTRRDVDKAHAKGRRLDIGILSVRNLGSIGVRRVLLWLLLGLSSIPLHLLYNSAVFPVLFSNNYKVYVGSDRSINTDCQDCTGDKTINTLYAKLRNGTIDKFSPAECMAEYGTQLQARRENVILVTTDDSFSEAFSNASSTYFNGSMALHQIHDTSIYEFGTFNASKGFSREANVSYSWAYTGVTYFVNKTESVIMNDIRASPDTWSVGQNVTFNNNTRFFGWPVQYCLSERATAECKLQISLDIAVVVTALNLLKAVLMFYVLYSSREDPLMTMGDAISSFLETEDETTKTTSLFSFVRRTKDNGWYSAVVKPWSNVRYEWIESMGRYHRHINLWIFLAPFLLFLVLFISWVNELSHNSILSIGEALRLGFGAFDSRLLVFHDSANAPSSVAGLAVVANMPQVLLSILYFSYNSSFTAMLMGQEWVSFAHERKGLRVSRKPRGAQRSTYFLQLPYRYGIPLAALSAGLHWLVSQSVFMVAFDITGSISKIRTCGWSPLAMVVAWGLTGIMIVGFLVFGSLHYRHGMPLAYNSSMAISSACHPEEPYTENVPISELKLQWGVVAINKDGIGRCSFSSGMTLPLLKGGLYI